MPILIVFQVKLVFVIMNFFFRGGTAKCLNYGIFLLSQTPFLYKYNLVNWYLF